MSALRKSGMVEGKPGETGNLTAKTSVFLRQTGRFCCVTWRAFSAWPVLPVAARVAE
jgi:hypothetical protein